MRLLLGVVAGTLAVGGTEDSGGCLGLLESSGGCLGRMGKARAEMSWAAWVGFDTTPLCLLNTLQPIVPFVCEGLTRCAQLAVCRFTRSFYPFQLPSFFFWEVLSDINDQPSVCEARKYLSL
jgi:hypothetical protein